jgi:hypothetical protein
LGIARPPQKLPALQIPPENSIVTFEVHQTVLAIESVPEKNSQWCAIGCASRRQGSQSSIELILNPNDHQRWLERGLERISDGCESTSA